MLDSRSFKDLLIGREVVEDPLKFAESAPKWPLRSLATKGFLREAMKGYRAHPKASDSH